MSAPPQLHLPQQWSNLRYTGRIYVILRYILDIWDNSILFWKETPKFVLPFGSQKTHVWKSTCFQSTLGWLCNPPNEIELYATIKRIYIPKPLDPSSTHFVSPSWVSLIFPCTFRNLAGKTSKKNIFDRLLRNLEFLFSFVQSLIWLANLRRGPKLFCFYTYPLKSIS